MALANTYIEWLDLLREWVDVDDLSNSQITTSLALAQIRLNRELDSQYMEAQVTVPTQTPPAPIDLVTAIPDFNRVRLVTLTSTGQPFETVAINEFQKLVALANGGSGNGNSFYYAIEGQKLNIFPHLEAGTDITVFYYMMVPTLNATTVQTNIFTIYHADALLFAAALELSKFIVEDERITTWEQSYQNALKASNAMAKNAKMGSTHLRRNFTMFSQAG
jgi:hypothetical protein